VKLGAYTACLHDRPLEEALDVLASIRWLGPLMFHAAAKDAMITPGVDIRSVLDTSFERVPAETPDKVPTGYGSWCNAWPANPAWRFVAAGIGHDVPYWTEFLRALAEIDSDMAVNIEHEDASYSRLEGLTSPPLICAPRPSSCRTEGRHHGEDRVGPGDVPRDDVGRRRAPQGRRPWL
jgi:hypothetical protein